MKPIIIFLFYYFVTFAIYAEQSSEWEGKIVPKLLLADGTIYLAVTFTKISADSITISHSGGFSQIPLSELRPESKKALGYGPSAVGSSQPSKPNENISYVTATGRASSEEEATKKALGAAVAQVVGSLVYSSTTIEGDDIVEDQINQLSNGFVKSYELLESRNEGDLWKVVIQAEVEEGTVADFLRSKGVETKVDLHNNWAQLTSGIQSKKQALELFNSKINSIKGNLFSVSLVDLKTGKAESPLPEPYIEEDLDGNATCLWAAKIESDLDFWNDCAHPLFKACFDTLCVGSKTIRIKYTASQSDIKALDYAYQIRHHNRGIPDTPPPFMDVEEPRLYWTNSPGIHPSLFGQQKRPYQGEYVFEGQGGLFGLILEKPIGKLGSEVTFYFLTREVFTRLGLSAEGINEAEPDIGWVLRGITDIDLGGRGLWESRDNPGGIIGRSIDVNGIPNGNSPIYFGPWFQPGMGSHGISGASGGQSLWPTWKDLSCYTQPYKTGWSLNVIHGGRMIPLSTNMGDKPQPFSKWMYQPIIFDIPIDDLRKVSRVSVELEHGAPINPGLLGVMFEASQSGSVRVAEVFEYTPAAKAGIELGDELLSVNGNRVMSVEQAVILLRSVAAGAAVELTMMSGGSLKDLNITLQKNREGDRFRRAPKSPDQFSL